MNSTRYSVDARSGTALVMNNNAGIGGKKGPDPAKWELEHYMDKVYRTPTGRLCIPGAALRKAFVVACKFLDAKPKGAGFKSFGPLVEAALVMEDDAILNVEDQHVVPWTVIVNLDPSKGPRGPRGPRTRPMIPPPWQASTTMRVFDPRLTLEILEQIADKAGWMCGLLDARAMMMGRCDIEVKAL